MCVLEAGEGTEGAIVEAWRAAVEAERSLWSWGKGLKLVSWREESRVRKASWEVTFEQLLKEREVCQAHRWARWEGIVCAKPEAYLHQWRLGA